MKAGQKVLSQVVFPSHGDYCLELVLVISKHGQHNEALGIQNAIDRTSRCQSQGSLTSNPWAPRKSLPPMRLTARHFPACIPATEKKANPTRLCTVCSRRTDGRGKKICRESRYYCPDCGVGLCMAPCFRDYHM